MELAGTGLGSKELQFDVDGGPVEIHKLILAEYPQLDAAGDIPFFAYQRTRVS